MFSAISKRDFVTKGLNLTKIVSMCTDGANILLEKIRCTSQR